jgi:hypothetical protein
LPILSNLIGEVLTNTLTEKRVPDLSGYQHPPPSFVPIARDRNGRW